MPTARGQLGAAVVNNRIYAIGGVIGQIGPGGTVFSTVEEYDPVSDVWREKADMPIAMDLFGTSVVNGRIYTVGGLRPIGQTWFRLSDTLEYDPMTDKWVRRDDMPTRRAGLATATVNGRIYAIGGMFWDFGTNQFAPLAVVEEYNVGFVNIEEKDKLSTTWGEVKSD
jgi:N-acetylneuraminic acid mutarotase